MSQLPSATGREPGQEPGLDLAREPEPDRVQILLQRLDPDLPVPGYAHPGDAGADLFSTIDVTLQPGQRQTVPTGVAIALPLGFAAFVHPRSGLSARHGVTIVNAPGTVDAGYRGEIQVTLLNTDIRAPVTLRRGDRIAQLVIQRVSTADFVQVDRLPGSARGGGGFGSTGGFGSGPSISEAGSVDGPLGDERQADELPVGAGPADGLGAVSVRKQGDAQ